MGSCCQSKSQQGDTSLMQSTSDDTAIRRPQPRKNKKSSETSKSAKQSFNGKTYACMSCKNGHRVRQCDHGYDRPVSATNQPGRPSSGSKRKCTCPKDCACFDQDNCKCERNCVCVEAMYLIVHVSKKGSPKIQHKVSKIERSPSPIISRVNERGQQEVLQKVYTDLTGKPLSEEETKRRNEEREKREQTEQDQKRGIKAESSAKSTPFESISYDLPANIFQTQQSLISSTLSPAPTARNIHASVPPSGTLSPAAPFTPNAWDISSPSCCQHASNSSQTPYPLQVFPSHNVPSIQVAEPGCNCGATCQCIHCPEHANNAATRQYNQQQFAHMANNSYLPSNFQIPGPLFRPEVPQASCMGGPTTFRLSSRPPQPTDLAHMFPDAKPGSYVMQYEIKRNPQGGFHEFVPGMNGATSFALPEDLSVESFTFDDANVNTSMNEAQLNFETLFDGPDIGWDDITIGEASVNQIPNSRTMVLPAREVVGNPNNYMPDANTANRQLLSYAHPGYLGSSHFPDADMPHAPALAPGLLENLVTKHAAQPVPVLQQPVRDRPNGNTSEPWIQDFTIDGPFMGHPASPVASSSPIPMGAF